MIVIRVFGDVLPDDFFCEKAGRRTAAAFGLWLFLPGGEGVGADAVPGCYFAIGAIFKFCKDFLTDMGWIGHDFDGCCFFCYLTIKKTSATARQTKKNAANFLK